MTGAKTLITGCGTGLGTGMALTKTTSGGEMGLSAKTMLRGKGNGSHKMRTSGDRTKFRRIDHGKGDYIGGRANLRVPAASDMTISRT